MNAPSCGACAYFVRNAQVIGLGHCICMPPLVIAVANNGAAGLMPVRPPVQSTDVCGQWKPKEEKPNGEDHRSSEPQG